MSGRRKDSEDGLQPSSIQEVELHSLTDMSSDSSSEDETVEPAIESDEEIEEPLEGAPAGFNGGIRRVSLPFCGKERKDSLKGSRIPIEEMQEVPRVSQGVVGRICKDWVILWPLGKGNGGSVYLGSHVKTGEKVAIKIISKAIEKDERVTRKRVKRSLKEACIMKRLKKAKRVVQLQEVFEDDENMFIIMQYAEGGDLFEYIKRRGKLAPSEAWHIFQQVLRTMAKVHSLGIVHRDLKPENVFLDKSGKVLIGDWGLACRWSSYKKNSNSCGSINYAASEIVCRRPYTGPEVDMFSMGAILYTMLTGRLPFGAVGSKDTLNRVAKGQFYVDKCLPLAAVNLLQKLFDPNPLKRATIYDVLSSSADLKEQMLLADGQQQSQPQQQQPRKKELEAETNTPPSSPQLPSSSRRRCAIYC